MTRFLRHSIAILLATALGGCAAGREGASQTAPPPDEPALAGLSVPWTLTTIRGQGIGPIDRPPTLQLVEGSRIGGHAGVNRYSAPLDTGALGDGAFVLGPAVATRMAGPPEAMALESDFLAALGAVARYDPRELEGGRLRLLDADGRELLTFAQGD